MEFEFQKKYCGLLVDLMTEIVSLNSSFVLNYSLPQSSMELAFGKYISNFQSLAQQCASFSQSLVLLLNNNHSTHSSNSINNNNSNNNNNNSNNNHNQNQLNLKLTKRSYFSIVKQTISWLEELEQGISLISVILEISLFQRL